MKNKVNLTLVGMDGNAFVILGAFQRQARMDGWTAEEINEVMDEARSGDYDNLLATISSHCVNGGFGSGDEYDDWADESEDNWYDDDEEEDEE